MQAPRVRNVSLLHRLKGRTVSDVVVEDGKLVRVQFSDGAVLSVCADADGLAVQVALEQTASPGGAPKPTARQQEYLAFIARYLQRYGQAPAESDIGRHFLVSAPTVNQMMQMLERRGFITRKPGVPRCIRLCRDVSHV